MRVKITKQTVHHEDATSALIKLEPDRRYPISTSPLEGMNNKIKVIKRKAYGFHDSEYFALKVKQAFAA